MRYFRLMAGLIIVSAALWIIVAEQMAGASANAVVNARLAVVRAPVAGEVTLPNAELGAIVRAGTPVATVNDPLRDAVRHDDLSMERDFAAATLARIESRIESLDSQMESLAARGERYSARRIEELEIRLLHARTRLRVLEGGGSDEDDQRLADAVDDQPARLAAEPLLPELALEHARERVEVLKVALDAARSGVFLGDGYNDAPNAEQRRTELATQRAQLAAEQAEAAARLDAVNTRLDRETLRVTRLSGGDIASPVDGLLWETRAAGGTVVQRGDPLLTLVDCGSAFVTLSVTENVYNTLTVGMAAEFQPSGVGRSFDGTVLRLAGSGAATVYRDLAVAPSPRHLERFDVALLVPGLRDDPELYCAVGRTGRAFFARRPLDGLRSLFGG